MSPSNQDAVSPRIERALKTQQLSLDDVSRLAPAVEALSDQYTQSEGSLTPWSNNELALAYITYFLPLNAARLAHAWREVERFAVAPHISEIWDIGSGPGTLQWVLEARGWPGTLHNVEISAEAVRWHQTLQMAEDRIGSRWHKNVAPQTDGALGVFSYSLLELPSEVVLNKFDHLLILEPSTHTRARHLMELRSRLIQQGFEIVAPCTHQGACPLLTHSSRDWCHQRLHWSPPSWWTQLESHLPMKNRTLTYSYILASRQKIAQPFAGRVIGDTLHERGKVRQMFCRGEQREFLSWLTRHGEPESVPHGALLNEIPKHEMKNSELRVLSPIRWSE